MDGRDGMALSGSSSYYIQRGYSGSASATQPPNFHSPHGFRSDLNPGVLGQPNSSVRGSSAGSTFPVEPAQSNFHRGINMGARQQPPSEPAKRKRGRPRKYSSDGAVSLGLSPMSAATSSALTTALTPKRARGRPPGSGRKQRLATLGQWMTESAGQAFAPHIISVGVGEDVAAKVLSFSQQRPRAVCIMSGNGAVSAVTLRQPASSGGDLTYEGRFEILCLSGSYLVSESGGPRCRVGGINVSLSTSGGPVIGGSAAMLIAASPVQVVACSFVYGSSKTKTKTVADPNGSQNSLHELGESATPSSAPGNQHLTASSAMTIWQDSRSSDPRNPHNDIDLTQG